ncbi:hypothetical protein BHM03_00036197 [Ensete ventricosum]|nr:hypothetical protein BHM03_00036197 [Ensete ventricosum]
MSTGIRRIITRLGARFDSANVITRGRGFRRRQAIGSGAGEWTYGVEALFLSPLPGEGGSRGGEGDHGELP